ncbi:YciI family protein [Streptomyces sp. WMMB303]|uniref:YciI family protein n=1 Tax=Streptomyces sp. WMMB303 TaxID=3034154 RepID=UPI0023EDBBFF|nr:YciI family protein [Streptomyces sp. WMMB303]MDF4249035.1 YciI family protein [Streptomyces sp. WMMB303]
MLILELAFTDDPERLAARPAHRKQLADLHAQGKLVAAGPWTDDSGAALIFDASRSELEAVLSADPYYRTPGVRVVSVREWAPVVGPAAPGAEDGPGA